MSKSLSAKYYQESKQKKKKRKRKNMLTEYEKKWKNVKT